MTKSTLGAVNNWELLGQTKITKIHQKGTNLEVCFLAAQLKNPSYYSDAGTQGARGATGSPPQKKIFSSSTNYTPTMGGSIIPTYYYWPPNFFTFQHQAVSHIETTNLGMAQALETFPAVLALKQTSLSTTPVFSIHGVE